MTHIFLHGLGQGPDSWDGVLAAFPEQGECPDLTSFFAKGGAAYRDLYRGFCTWCEGKTPPLGLCGLSLGAVLALHYALDHPERVGALVRTLDPAVTVHDFRVTAGPLHTNLIFDMVVPYSVKDTDRALRERVQDLVRVEMGEHYYTVIEIDRAYVR